MVRIPNPIGTSGKKVPVMQQQFIDADAASKVLQVSARGKQAELGMELQKFAQINQQVERQALITQELEHQANLQTSLPKLYSDLQSQVITAVNAIKTIDEEQRKLEQKQAEDVFLATNSIRLQEDYIHFTEGLEVKPDGAGYTQDVLKFINDRSEQLLQAAPSEESRLEMFSYLGKFKLGAMQEAKEFERQKRIDFRTSEFMNAAQSLRFQAQKNPDTSETYINQFNSYKEALIADGVPLEKVQKLMSSAVEQVEMGRLEGLVNSGRATQALGELNSDRSFKRLSNEGFAEAAQTIGVGVVKADEDLTKQIRKAALAEQYKSGVLPSAEFSAKERREVASEVFKEYIMNSFNEDGTTIEGLSPVDAQNKVVDFYQDLPNVGMVAEHNQMISSGIVHGAPVVAAQNAAMVATLANNPRTANVVDDLPSNVRNEAMKINSLVSFGYTPEEAVDMTRKSLRSTDPNRLKVINEEASAFLSDGGAAKLLEDGYDTWYSWWDEDSIINAKYIKPELEEIFKAEAQASGDMEVARKNTVQRMLSKYNVSYVNSEPTMMEAAPESVYTPKEMEWFNRDYNNYLVDVALETIGEEALNKFVPVDFANYEKSGVILATKPSEFIQRNKVLPFKGSDGVIKPREVYISTIPGVTAKNGNPTYGLYWKDNNAPIRLSDLNPEMSDQYISYSFNKEESSEFKENEAARQMRIEEDRKWRQDMASKYGEIKKTLKVSANKRNLTNAEENVIMKPFSKIDSILNEKQ